MARRVMMLCPRSGPQTPVYSGISAPEGDDLTGLVAELVNCPHCGNRHTIEAAHFEGTPPPQHDWNGLDCNRECAAEIGIIVAEVAAIESHLSSLMRCVIGIDEFAAHRILGRFEKLMDRVDTIADLANQRLEWDETPDTSKKELTRIVELISAVRTALTIRNKYVHATFGIGADQAGRPVLHVLPFLFDTRRKKPKPTESRTFAEVVRDRQIVRKAQMDLHAYLHIEGHISHTV